VFYCCSVSAAAQATLYKDTSTVNVVANKRRALFMLGALLFVALNVMVVPVWSFRHPGRVFITSDTSPLASILARHDSQPHPWQRSGVSTRRFVCDTVLETIPSQQSCSISRKALIGMRGYSMCWVILASLSVTSSWKGFGFTCCGVYGQQLCFAPFTPRCIKCRGTGGFPLSTLITMHIASTWRCSFVTAFLDCCRSGDYSRYNMSKKL
jgi:hypothetical protein